MAKIGELDMELRPSKIEGIGVFANINIKKDSKFMYDKKDRIISKSKTKDDKKLYEKCEKICVERKDHYVCPQNFLAMSVLWFLKHSKKPNLKKSKGCFIATKDVKKGEELTIDYEYLDENVDNVNFKGKKF